MASQSSMNEDPGDGGGKPGRANNSYRLSRLFLTCGHYLTRELLLQRINTADAYNSLQDFLSYTEIKAKLTALKNKKNGLTQAQIGVLYPGDNAMIDPNTWDTSLIMTILINCFDLQLLETNTLQTLKQFRRYLFGEGSGQPVSGAEFDLKWKEISTFFRDSASNILTSPEHRQALEKLMGDIESGAVTPEDEKDYLRECHKYLLEMSEEGKPVKGKNLFKETAHILRAHTKALERMHIAAATTEMMVLIGKFKASNILVLKGPKGSGKTHLAKSIMCDMMKGEETDQIILRTPTEILKHLGGRRKLLVLVDSALGHVVTNKEELQEWNDNLNVLLSKIEEGKLMLMFTIRQNIVDAVKDEAVFNLFKRGNTVDVTTFLDKRNALIVHASINEVRLTEERIRALCSMEYKGVGFQLLCSKLVRGTYEDVVQSFKNPVLAMKDEVQSMQAEHQILFITLMLTLLSGNRLRIGQLKDESSDFFGKVKQFWSSHVLDAATIEKSATDLVGLYLSVSRDGYSFINDTVLETVFLVAIETVQSLLMECCPLPYIGTFSMHIESHKMCFTYLINRIVREGNMGSVAQLHVWTNEDFVKAAVERLGVPYFYKQDKTQLSLIVYLSGYGHILALKGLDKNNNILKKFSQNEIDDQLTKSLLNACAKSQFDVVEYLVSSRHVKVTHEMLFKSLEGKDDPKVLSFLINKGGNIKETRPSGENIFHVACERGKVKILEYVYIVCEELSEATDKRGWTALHFAAKGGSIPCFDFVNNYRKYSPDTATKKGAKVVHIAAEGTSGFLAYLVSIGFDITAKTSSGQTVLHLAALLRNIDTVWFLSEVYKEMLPQKDDKGWNPLHYAAKGGCVKCIQYLIDKELDPRSPTADGKTVLHVAAESGMREATEYFCKSFKELYRLKDSQGHSPIYLACVEGFTQIIQLLIESGMDPSVQTFTGETIVHACIRNGSISNLRYICGNFGGLLESVDNDGNNILHFAAMIGFPAVIDYLINCGMDPYSTAKKKRTILHSAASANRMENVKYICEQFPDMLNSVDDKKRNVLYYASMFGSVELLNYLVHAGADTKTIRKLGITLIFDLLKGAKVENAMYICETMDEMLHVTDADGNNPLHYAAIANSFEFLIYLLETKNEDPFIHNYLGKTMLHLAAYYGHVEIVKHICRTYRTIMKMDDSKDWSPIHDAASGGSLDCLIYLIRKGIKAGVRTSDKRTILHVAAHYGKTAVVKWISTQYKYMLSEFGDAYWSVLHDAASGSSVSCLRHLIKIGVDPTTRTADGKTIIHVAACFGKVDAVDYLCAKYKDLLNERDFAGNNALHYAAMGGNLENFIALVLENIDKHAVNQEGGTALHTAAKAGSAEVVTYICRNHIEYLRVRDKKGLTALHSAALGGSIPCVETLIRNGMNPEALTKDGATIIELSVEHPELHEWIKVRMQANKTSCEKCVVQ